MNQLKEIFMQDLDTVGIQYTDADPDAEDSHAVTVGFDLNGQPEGVNYIVFFDDEDQPGFQVVAKIAHFDDSRRAAGLELCNELNGSYRWMKFYIDSDQDVLLHADDSTDPDHVTQQVMSLINSLNNIIMEVYPKFMKALWA